MVVLILYESSLTGTTGVLTLEACWVLEHCLMLHWT
jgi:hypothetical protein